MDPLPPLAILIPVLARPERVKPLLDSIYKTSPDDVRVVFICSPNDYEQRGAVIQHGLMPYVMKEDPGDGDYARKLNQALFYVSHVRPRPVWALLGADDLCFHEGWYEAAMRIHDATGACVIGTNDLGNQAVMSGQHATHPLVKLEYRRCGAIDDVSRLLHEGYSHNFVDNEFIGTAKMRGTFAFAEDSLVEHLHPIWHKGEEDATYRKGQQRFQEDRALFEARRHKWEQR